MNKRMARVICVALALIFTMSLFLTGCGSKTAEQPKQETAAKAEEPKKEEPKKEEPKKVEAKKLKLAMFSNEQDATYKKLNITEALKKAKNIDLEIEKFKDST
ncbi:MAG: hypothetical protein N2112_17290, partial [Gemmataceae bacterium]|nr:hypothetical protein [Gemmataceae bacterium]